MTKRKSKNELLINERLREELIERVEVLDRVKELLLLPNTEFGTVKQVADFYDVSIEVVNNLAFNHEGEFSTDGFSLYKKDEVLNLLSVDSLQLKNMKGKTIATLDDGNEIVIPNRGLRLFPRRAVLRVGMLLKESKVAEEVRNQLLNIEEKTSVEVKVVDIGEEKDLMLSKRTVKQVKHKLSNVEETIEVLIDNIKEKGMSSIPS